MRTIYHQANSRGKADLGWLQTRYTFSFANYYDPERMHFGKLRVLNDDIIAPGMGFGTHPHDNMEIITIVLEGVLEHRDSMGNVGVIRANEIQVMSAGRGITHSEYNHSKEHPVKLLQIWIYSNKRNVEPRYDQIQLDPADRINKFQQVVSPGPSSEDIWIYQNAWFHLGHFEPGRKLEFERKLKGNGIYVFLIEGTINVEGVVLNSRDGLGIYESDAVGITVEEASDILIMDVPMG